MPQPKAPSSNIQAPEKFQSPNIANVLFFEAWCLVFPGAWDLELFQKFLAAPALFSESIRDNPQHCLTIGP